MRLPSFTHNKISPFLALLLVALVVFGIGMPHAAQANVIFAPITAFGWLAKILAYVVLGILMVVLFIESFIIDNLFIFNIVLNPTNMPAVKGAWVVLRDVANSLFLLILLWLAIKIIWGFDDGASKKLLVRLIIVAFLINFSLVITGAMFGFGNALAKPFKDKIGNDVAGYIVGIVKLNTAMNFPANPPKIPQANECLLSKLTDSEIKVDCPEKTNATQAMDFISGAGGAIVGGLVNNSEIKQAMQMWIANIFIILTIITFGGVGGFLIVRIAMMAFLGVLSPAAFFLYAVPGGEKLFNRWRDNLIGWSFIAPTFYFLFYVSLLVLTKMMESPLTKISSQIPFAANLFAMIPLVIFLIFLWATLSVCKKLGAEVADVAIGMGKAAAGIALTAAAGVATGGASLAAGKLGGMVAGKFGTTAPAVLDKLEGRPILRTLARPITGTIRSYYEKRNQGIDEKKEKIKRMNRSSPSLVDEFKRTRRPDQKVAIAETLRERADGSFDKLDKSSQDIYADSAKRLGRDAYLQARPDKATKETVPDAKNDYEAKKGIFNKMTSATKRMVSKYALEDDDTKKAFLETMTRADLQDIIRHNAEMTHTLIFDFFTKNQQIMQQIMKQETLSFIYGTMRVQTLAGGMRSAAQPTQGTPPTGGPTPATPPPIPPPPTPPPTQSPTP